MTNTKNVKKISVLKQRNLLTFITKGVFSYIEVSSPLDRSKRFTLFLLWQTCSFRHQLDFSGKHSSHAAIRREDYTFTFPPPPIAIYSFIQMSGLGHRGENENALTLKRLQREFEHGLRVRHSTTELPQ